MKENIRKVPVVGEGNRVAGAGAGASCDAEAGHAELLTWLRDETEPPLALVLAALAQLPQPTPFCYN